MGIGIVSNIKQGHLEHALFGESGLASLMLYIGIIGFGLTAFLVGQLLPSVEALTFGFGW